MSLYTSYSPRSVKLIWFGTLQLDEFNKSCAHDILGSVQAGSYPGTGKIDQIGSGSGEGSTLNLPLPGGSGDTAMRKVYDEVIVPCAQRFKPDIILVSAG